MKNYFLWNPATCSCKNEKCLGGVMDDSAITRDEIIEDETKTITRNFN